MSAELKPNLQLEIAHVLFMDVVGYSKLLTDDQLEAQQQLNQIVRGTEQFVAAEAEGKLLRLPSGDGMALVFFGNPEAPVRCAMEISQALRNHPKLQVRMGIHSGPVTGVPDVNDHSSVAGAGINMAQRVMDCGDANHILLSKRASDDLTEYRHWHPLLHDLGQCEVKHGVMVSVVNFYTDEIGNAQTPEKLKGKTPVFGNFEISRDATGNPLLLGRGTFGRTYQARHRYLETIVALKIISERFATDASARRGFLTEARAAAKLSHPHIARLHDFGEKDGVLFYAMEFCSGGDLAEYVKKNGKLAPEQLLEVAGQLGGALQCAHAAGLVHRDIKPSNVMLAGGDGPLATKLIDFGLVHVHGGGNVNPGGEGSESHLLGTPLFASPEQLREEPADARADLFSLGMTLWYLALGRSPENGSLSEITTSRLNAESYRHRLPDALPAPLRTALARLLEKDPAKRFATATEFLRELGHDDKKTAAARLPGAAARAETTSPAAAEVEPLALEKVEAPLASEWQIGSRNNESLTGVTYPATAAKGAQQEAWLHVLHDTLVNNVDLLWRVRRNAAGAAALQLPGLLAPSALRGYSDGAAIVLEKPDCTSLLTAVKGPAAGVIVEFYPALEKIAATCDAVSAAGLPGVDLQPSNIWLQLGPAEGKTSRVMTAQPKLFPRFLAARDAPELSEATGGSDVASTISTEMVSSPGSADDMRAHFARLIYRLAAGRNCPAAASLATQAYVAVPNLSEQANRTLAAVIARQLEYASCTLLLANLRRSEGVASAATSSHAGRSRSGRATRLSSAPPSLTPPATRREAPGTARGKSALAFVPPVDAPAPPREPGARPAAPVKPARRGALIAASALFVVLGVAVILYRGSVSRTKPVPPPLPQQVETFPAGTKLRLTGTGIPKHVSFAVAGKALNSQPAGSDLVLNLENIPRRFPFEVLVEAAGFKKTVVGIKDDAELAAAQPLSLFRSTGRILFVGLPSDYTHASASMKALLPAEKDLDEIRLERADRGTEIRAGGRNAIELATGIYAVNLRGDNGRSVRPRLLSGQFEIKADETATITLPTTFAGRYQGNANDPADGNKKLELEINIESGLANGEITERRGSSSRHGSWSDGYLDREGLYRAKIHFAGPEGPNVTDAGLVLRAVDERKIALATEAGDAAPEIPLYSAVGELQRRETKPGS